jgi:membrane associated rhomboid family serine protease
MLVRAPVEIIVLNVALGLALPIIDNAAHLGGLAAGILLGAALGVRPEVRRMLGAQREGSAPAPGP